MLRLGFLRGRRWEFAWSWPKQGGEAFSWAAHEGKSQQVLAGRGGVREVAGEGVEESIVCGCCSYCLCRVLALIRAWVHAVLAAGSCYMLLFFLLSGARTGRRSFGLPLVRLCCCAASPPSCAHLRQWQVHHHSLLSLVWSVSCGNFKS